MEKTNDGFIIADEDLKLRGPGEFFGLRQSGFFQFKIADMVQDGSLLRQARSSAFDLIVQDQKLTNDSNKRLREWFISDYNQYLDTIKLSR
jgi:ATP-dependent DNA helicase RecG